MGAAPASMAKAASEDSRPGCDQLIGTWAPVTGPTPGWASSADATARASVSSSPAELLGLLVGCQGPLGRGPQRPHGGPVLHRIR